MMELFEQIKYLRHGDIVESAGMNCKGDDRLNKFLVLSVYSRTVGLQCMNCGNEVGVYGGIPKSSITRVMYYNTHPLNKLIL